MASETIPEEPESKLQKLETNGKHDQPINVVSPLHIRKVKASETIPEEPASKLQKLETNGKHDQPINVDSPLLWVKKLSANAVLPSRGSSLSAGYDLSSASATIVPARGKAMVPTDVSIGIREETYARIAPRSGLAWKHSIHVDDGVIDADYSGPVEVILLNHADADFEVKAGDRIAQLIIQKIMTPQVLEVEDLDLTVRENIHDKPINVDSPMRIRKVMASETIPEEPPSKLQKLETNGKHDQPINVDSPLLRVKNLSANAVLPSKSSSLSAVYDLSSASATIVPARGKAMVPTDLSIGIPEDTYARIAPRSGLAWKHSIDVGAGVIDADYRGPVGVILFNYSDADFEVKGGDRIAQLIIMKIMIPQALEGGDLDLTVRGEGGFGSTGV